MKPIRGLVVFGISSEVTMPSEKTPWDKGYLWESKWSKLNGGTGQFVSLENIESAAWKDWASALVPMLKLNNGFVALYKNDEYKQDFIAGASLLKLPVKRIKNPKYNNCHKGSAALYAKNPSRYVIYVGFSSEKKSEAIPMWRDHTIVVDIVTKSIVESTPLKRDYYYAAPLSKSKAKKFCEDEGFKVEHTRATLVKAAAQSVDLTINEYQRLIRRIERLEKHVLKRLSKPVPVASDKRPFQEKQVQNNQVNRIAKILKSDPRGIHALDKVDYDFYRANRIRFK